MDQVGFKWSLEGLVLDVDDTPTFFYNPKRSFLTLSLQLFVGLRAVPLDEVTLFGKRAGSTDGDTCTCKPFGLCMWGAYDYP